MTSLTVGVRGFGDGLAIFLGLALSPVASWAIGGGFDLLAAGLVGGTIAFAVQRWRRRAMAGAKAGT